MWLRSTPHTGTSCTSSSPRSPTTGTIATAATPTAGVACCWKSSRRSAPPGRWDGRFSCAYPPATVSLTACRSRRWLRSHVRAGRRVRISSTSRVVRLFSVGGAPIVQTLAFAASLREVSELPLALGGGVVDAAGARELVHAHHAALVSVGRPLLADPYWALRVSGEAGIPTSLSPAYRLALGATSKDLSKASEGTVFSPDHPKHIDGLEEEE
jgi:hypothetical protein